MTRAFEIGREHAQAYFTKSGDIPDSPPPSFKLSNRIKDEYCNTSLNIDFYPWGVEGVESATFQEASLRAQREDLLSEDEVEALRRHDICVADSAIAAELSYEAGWKAEAALQYESQLLFFLNQKSL